MPASPCRLYTDPEGRAAWLALEKAEIGLEKVLLNANGAVAKIGGQGYYIEDSRMLCAPLFLNGELDKEHHFHRDDYEGLALDDMKDLTKQINEWFEANATLERLKSDVLRLVYDDARIQKLNGYQLLAGKHLKTGVGIFVAHGNFGRPQFKVACAEAKAAGLKSGRMYVYGRTATYSGAAICFCKFDEIGIER